jgi:hypothetical protein
MKVLRTTAQQAAWVLSIGAVVVALVLALPRGGGLQSPPTEIGPSGENRPTQTPAGYPGRVLASQAPSGYSGPEPTSDYVVGQPTQQALILEPTRGTETEEVRLTAEARIAEVTPITQVGPRTIVDSDGYFSLEVPEGWWGSTTEIWRGYFATQIFLRNFADDDATDVKHLPEGAIVIFIGQRRFDDVTVDAVLKDQMTRQVDVAEEFEAGSGDGLRFTSVQPFQLGPFSALEYYMTNADQDVARYLAFAHEDRMISIYIRPGTADSPTMDEALAILSTLTFLAQ